MKKKQRIAWIMAGVLCLSTVVTACPAETADAMTTIETNVTTASEGCTMLGVYGSYYSQAQDGLDRINEIRKEACEAGNVPDPRDASRTLTAADYVPIKWSADLESIARIRAAEGGLAYGFLSSGHDRLNGKGTFSVSYNGLSSSAEDLAYNGGTSMVSGINQWYGEKDDWVNQTAGTVTGHYTSMINPNYTYVGLGDFYTEEARYPNTLAGEFSAVSQNLDQTMQEAPMNVMQKIEVKNSYITEYFLDGVTTVYTDKTTTLTPKANLVNASQTHKLWVIDPVTYTSSDPAIATVASDGVVTGLKNGETVITASSADGVLASAAVMVKCDHAKELLSSTLPTCTAEGLKIYHCEVCGESIEQKIPKIPHDYIYGDADSEGYRTGICSICQDTLTIIPPTTYTLWWRNSTSDSSMYSSAFPNENPIDSTIYCWINDVDGDTDYQDMMIESADESVISVPETAVPNSPSNRLCVLAPGITTITVYPKYNPALKKSWTVRIGDAGSVDITTADTELSQGSYAYTGKACTPDVSVSYHDVPLKKGTDYTVAYENNIEAGTATAVITGTGIFKGTIRKNFTITGLGTETPGTETPGTGTETPGTETPGTETPGTGTETPGTETPGTGTETPGTETPGTGTETPGTETPGTGTETPGTETPGTGTETPGTETPGTGTETPGTGTETPGTGSSGTETPKPETPKLSKGTSHKIGSYQYKITGTATVSMTGKSGNNVTKIKVPKTVQIAGKTFQVTAIANCAFQKDRKIISVIMGDNVKTIGRSAFEGCSKVTKVTLGKGVTKIGSSAFKNCRKMGTMVVKSTKLKQVGKNALKGMKVTAKVKVPAKKLTVYKKLFKNKGQGNKVKITK